MKEIRRKLPWREFAGRPVAAAPNYWLSLTYRERGRREVLLPLPPPYLLLGDWRLYTAERSW